MLRGLRNAGIALVGLLAIGFGPRGAVGQGNRDLSAERVRESIDNGVAFLKHTQQRNGQWPDIQIYENGTTALVALALLNCGVPPTDPSLAAALRVLENQGRGNMTVYVSALRLMVFCTADPAVKRYGRLIQQEADYLIQQQVREGAHVGGWGYGLILPEQFQAILNVDLRTADSSNSQFALLGLHEAARVGYQVPREVWEGARLYWRNVFNPNRGWFSYSVAGDRPNGSMTCAGISSLVIIEENLADPGHFLKGGKVVCCQPSPDDSMVQLAMNWLAEHFSVSSNPAPQGGGSLAKYYYLYGMERAGRLSGQRFIGPWDWYREGAAHLVNDQAFDGSWHRADSFGISKDINTAFGLLFLSKGRRPIVFGKYKYGPAREWDLHPPGVQYLTREIEKAWQLPLNWQTVDGNTASVNDLLEAPVLVLSGQSALNLEAAQKQALKAYIENGGFLFVEACQGDGCGDSVPFDSSFRALMVELFPDSKLEALSPDHPIWTANFKIQPDPGWPILGLQACCRTSVVYCPRNLSCYWQMDRPNFHPRLPKTVSEQVVYCRQLGINVAAYATNRILDEKLDRPKLKETSLDALKDRVLVLPKLRHQGGADEAPNAWRNLLQDFRAQTQMNLNPERKMIDPTFEQMADHPFLFMHGRTRFSFDPQQRQEIRRYLQRGGFIFADSICSSREFTDAFRREFAAIFPELTWAPIPADHPLWNDEKYGYNLNELKVTLRTPNRDAPGGFTSQKMLPQLEGLTIDNRLAVVFSPHDLSCALENASATQCQGYSRDDALRIGTNVILYRLRVD